MGGYYRRIGRVKRFRFVVTFYLYFAVFDVRRGELGRKSCVVWISSLGGRVNCGFGRGIPGSRVPRRVTCLWGGVKGEVEVLVSDLVMVVILF